MSKLLIYSMHRTDHYWRFVAARLKQFQSNVIVADQAGCGDVSTQPRFYALMKGKDPERFVDRQLGHGVVADIIARCRVLRSLDAELAVRMVGAMWMSVEEIVKRERPEFGLSFCIDRFSMDVISRVCALQGVPFAEVTASVLPSKILFMQRGRGVATGLPSENDIESCIDTLVNPSFSPSYVKKPTQFSQRRLLKTFAYSELRGAYFNLIRHIRRDPLNCHYLDALKSLSHKIGFRDLDQLSFVDHHWRERFEAVPFDRRVFVGLQLYPEASMDYWIPNRDLLRYYDVVDHQTRVLSGAGFHVFVKDHPLMFGFRQVELLTRLARYPNVVFVPHEIPGRFLVNGCKATVTLTGTVGLEAAMAGRCSVTAAAGYYYVPNETVTYESQGDLEGIAARMKDWTPGDVDHRRKVLARHLASVSAPGELTGVAGFDGAEPKAVRDAMEVCQSLNDRMPLLREKLEYKPCSRGFEYAMGAM